MWFTVVPLVPPVGTCSRRKTNTFGKLEDLRVANQRGGAPQGIAPEPRVGGDIGDVQVMMSVDDRAIVGGRELS